MTKTIFLNLFADNKLFSLDKNINTNKATPATTSGSRKSSKKIFQNLWSAGSDIQSSGPMWTRSRCENCLAKSSKDIQNSPSLRTLQEKHQHWMEKQEYSSGMIMFQNLIRHLMFMMMINETAHLTLSSSLSLSLRLSHSHDLSDHGPFHSPLRQIFKKNGQIYKKNSPLRQISKKNGQI